MTLGGVTLGSPAIDQCVEGLVNDFWGFNVKWIENTVQEVCFILCLVICDVAHSQCEVVGERS